MKLHPSTLSALARFSLSGLPEWAKPIGEEYARLAFRLCDNLEGPNLTTALRQLHESMLEVLFCDVKGLKSASPAVEVDLLREHLGLDDIGGGQSPGDPPPTNPFDLRLYTIGIDKVGGGQSPGDPPPTNPFGKGPIDLIIDRKGPTATLVEIEVNGKSVALEDVGAVEKIEGGMVRLTIPR